MSLLRLLGQRQLIAATTDPAKLAALLAKRTGAYCGADPTAPLLHLGNLLPLMVLLHFRLAGHHAVGLVGGATGEVGDPSGRDTERLQMAAAVRATNIANIQLQMDRFLNHGVQFAKTRGWPVEPAGTGTVANNATWWTDMPFLHFLGTYGRHMRVPAMLARDSVKSRLALPQGLGLHEFAYQTMQAYDFLHLFRQHGVAVQIGGNDQWGNITAGVDLIGRVGASEGAVWEAHGVTVPLLTTASGAKFGKSAGNAVFLDRNITPPFDLYQYLVKTSDEDVEGLLRRFTLLREEQVCLVMEEHTKDPAARTAQRLLASEVTELVHGNGAGTDAARVTQALFPMPGEPFLDMEPVGETVEAFRNAGILRTLPADLVLDHSFSEVLLTVMGLSKSEARRVVKQGGLYVGVERVKVDPLDSAVVTRDVCVGGRLLVLRRGKAEYILVEVV